MFCMASAHTTFFHWVGVDLTSPIQNINTSKHQQIRQIEIAGKFQRFPTKLHCYLNDSTTPNQSTCQIEYRIQTELEIMTSQKSLLAEKIHSARYTY